MLKVKNDDFLKLELGEKNDGWGRLKWIQRPRERAPQGRLQREILN